MRLLSQRFHAQRGVLRHTSGSMVCMHGQCRRVVGGNSPVCTRWRALKAATHDVHGHFVSSNKHLLLERARETDHGEHQRRSSRNLFG